MNAVMVRVAYAEPSWGLVGRGEPGLGPQQRHLGPPGYLVVLADDAGHRALPAWIRRRNPGDTSIHDLLDRPADDVWTTIPLAEELAVRLATAAGGRVTGVEIYPVTPDPEEVNADTFAARIELGASHVTGRLDQGLTLAVVARAPVRVDAAVMDRLAVPVPRDDPAALVRTPAARAGPRVRVEPGERPRFEPRNMTFTHGLDRWHLDSRAPGDYSAAVEDSCAILSSVVPEPSGSAALMQTIFADDLRGAPVLFRGEFVTEGLTGSAGLCLRIRLQRKEPELEQEHIATTLDSRDWPGAEISASVPEDADIIQFGIVLTGSGRVRLRSPDLRRGDA